MDSSHKQQLTMISNPCDGPFRRARKEWMDPYSMWGIDDCGRLLDVSASFGGQQTIGKWLIWLWMISTIVYLWSNAHNAWFLGDLDHWALFFGLVYQTLSLANGHIQPEQMNGGPNGSGVNAYLKFFWIVFEIAAHLQLMVTFLFWAIVFPPSDRQLTYATFVLHGLGLAAVWIDGMVLNRIPVRIRHYFIVLAVDALYCAWTIIHAAAGLDSGRSPTEASGLAEDSEAIYLALDWRNQLVQTIFLTIAILTLLAPIFFSIQYCMSLYSFPWTWDGSGSRKCISMGTRDMGMELDDMDRDPEMGTSRRISHTRGPMGNSSRGMATSSMDNSHSNRNPDTRRAPRSNRNINEAVGSNSETSRTSSRKDTSPVRKAINARSKSPNHLRSSLSSQDHRPSVASPRNTQRHVHSSIPTTIRTTTTTTTTNEEPPKPTTKQRSKTLDPGRTRPKTPDPTSTRPKTPDPTSSRPSADKPAQKRSASVPNVLASQNTQQPQKKRVKPRKAKSRPTLNRDLSHMDIA